MKRAKDTSFVKMPCASLLASTEETEETELEKNLGKTAK